MGISFFQLIVRWQKSRDLHGNTAGSLYQCLSHWWHFRVFYSILEYSPAFSSILEHSPVSSSILEYSWAFSSILQYPPVFSSILQYSRVFSNILKYFPVFSSILQYSRVFSSIRQKQPLLARHSLTPTGRPSPQKISSRDFWVALTLGITVSGEGLNKVISQLETISDDSYFKSSANSIKLPSGPDNSKRLPEGSREDSAVTRWILHLPTNLSACKIYTRPDITLWARYMWT